MSRVVIIGLVCLAWSWAGGVKSAKAQSDVKPAKADKLVRVTYPVEDIVVQFENHSFRDIRKPRKAPAATPENIAEQLIASITQTIARESWVNYGGKGTIQYFPMGLALVVNQRPEVQEQVAALLAELHRLQGVQVAVELRLVRVDAREARTLDQFLDKNGKDVRVHDRSNSLSPNGSAAPIRSLDEKQLVATLERLQGNRSTQIMQSPKVTLFNGQQGAIVSGEHSPSGELLGGMQFDLLPVVEPTHKSVRLRLDMEMAFIDAAKSPRLVKVAGTFALPPERTLVWRLGEPDKRGTIFLLATTRVIIVEEEERAIAARNPGAKQEAALALPSPKYASGAPQPPLPSYPPLTSQADQPFTKLSAFQAIFKTPLTKKPAIEDRLQKPISLQFKETPLNEAAAAITKMSGVPIVLDEKALKIDSIPLDAPVSLKVEDIKMQSALTLLLKQAGLTYTVEDDLIKITTAASEKLGTKTYNVADLVEVIPTFEGKATGKEPGEHREIAGKLMELIKKAVCEKSWQNAGGQGTIQFCPNDHTLVVSQSVDVLEEVDQLLESLRKLQDLSVNADIRLVHASADTAQQCKQMMAEHGKRVVAYHSPRQMAETGSFVNKRGAGIAEPDRTNYTKESCPYVLMDGEHVRRLLGIVQQDRASSSIQVPKATILNGQNVPFECVQKEAVVTQFRDLTQADHEESTIRAIDVRNDVIRPKPANVVSQQEKIVGGWRCNLQPVVSPDRTQVRLQLSIEHTAKDEAKSVERITKAAKQFEVPDGCTLVWDIGETTHRQHLFIVVTPKIRVREPVPEPTTPR
jgi:hypothetical protein